VLSDDLAQSFRGLVFESGSTLGAPFVEASACGVEHESPGVWYVVEGDGTNITLSTCSKVTGFSTQISVFTGDCDGNLQCVGTNENLEFCEDDFSFQTMYQERYYILVHGALESEKGRFELRLDEEQPDACERARATLFTTGGDDIAFTIEDLLPEDESIVEIKLCGKAVDFGFGGHWYSVVGTGLNLTASTCNPGTDFDTQLSVFTGSCTSLVCVDGNDDIGGGEGKGKGFPAEDFVDGEEQLTVVPAQATEDQCGALSIVSWKLEAGQAYYVFIHGYNGNIGTYVLSIDSISQ
jgi:hypothetical protein